MKLKYQDVEIVTNMVNRFGLLMQLIAQGCDENEILNERAIVRPRDKANKGMP